MLNLSKYNRFDAMIVRNEGCLRKVCRLYGGDNSALRDDLSKYIYKKTKRNPMILSIIMDV